MRKLILILTTIFTTSFAFGQQAVQTPEEMALKEVERLERDLDLEYHQTFKLDSLLRSDFAKMDAEMQALMKSKVQERTVYETVQDKWLEHFENEYQKIFTDEQWKKYLRMNKRYSPKKRKEKK